MLTTDMYSSQIARKQAITSHGAPSCGRPTSSAAARAMPAAHTASPGAVSPLLSALVVKAAFFVLLRLWFDVFGEGPHVVLLIPGAIGTAQRWRTPRLPVAASGPSR